MFYVYILHSVALDKYYVGVSANPQVRMKKHNRKHKGFTRRTNDWTMVYTEVYSYKADALLRERSIKNKKSRPFIEFLINSKNTKP